MTARFDRFMALHPGAADYCRRMLGVWFSGGMTSGMISCLCVSLALGMIGENYNGLYYAAAVAVADIVFIQVFFLAGFLREWFAIFFGTVFFMLPHSIAELPESNALYSINSVLSELSRLMTKHIIRQLEFFRLYGFTASGAALILCVVLFALGMFVRTAAKRSDFYCRTRLEQLPDDPDGLSE